MLNEITPMVLTSDEAPNIARTLERLEWAKDILIVDSFSTDGTLEIVRPFPQARVVQRKFDTFAQQCNFGLQCVRSEWVFSLDADYVLSEEFSHEMAHLKPSADVAGYRAEFVYCIQGYPLRASLYPPRTVLYRKTGASYRDVGHGHRVQIAGHVLPLKSVIFHDDRKPVERWFADQIRYAACETEHLVMTPSSQLNAPDRIRRRIVFAPGLVFLYTLLWKGLIRDGWPGWYYVFQRTTAEIILSLRLIERRLKEVL